MKERLTINAPNENSQNYQNLLKDFDLLKSKYDNILLENTILNRNHQQNRVFNFFNKGLFEIFINFFFRGRMKALNGKINQIEAKHHRLEI